MPLNNNQEKNHHKINPLLFKEGPTPVLAGEVYYAYLDKVEQSNSVISLHFDCVVKSFADEVEINQETLLDFPSILIQISGDAKTIRNKIGYQNLYLLESSGMLIKTNIQEANIKLLQLFNFIQVGNDIDLVDYNLENVILFRDMDDTSKSKVRELVKATTLEESTKEEIEEFTQLLEKSVQGFDHVNVYNVGQGSCNGLVNSSNYQLLYFDVGGGYGSHKVTSPSNFRICTSSSFPVILSHWDQDHVQTAIFDPKILESKWLVPTHSSIGTTLMHVALALKGKGNLVCWNSSFSYIEFAGHRISKCTGSPRYKNSSGLALFVLHNNNDFVLLPGDARYDKISSWPDDSRIIGMVASHHGSAGSIKNMPIAYGPGMLVYSYGIPNHHTHPDPRAVAAYNKNGWINNRDTPNQSIAMKTMPILLDTPCKNLFCTLNILQHF